MKRLLILANSDSAIFKFRQELINALAEHFHIGLGIPFGQYMDEIRNDKYEFFDIPVNRHGMNPVEDLKLKKHYEKVIDEFKPDVVLEYTIKPNLYGSMVCAKRNIPCLCNITGLGTALENPGMLQKLLVAMYKHSMKKVHTIFFQNSAGCEFFKNHGIGRNEQYVLLPGSGVNLERFEYIEYPTSEKQFFLFVARVIKQKGIDEYLSVAQRFHDEGLSAEFHICGACEEEYQEKLEKLNAEGVIVYHGLVKDMREMYAKSTCVILPSYYPEGQSNVLLEGAASGRPLITTDHPGCREAVENEITGYLVKRQDADDLYEKTRKVYEMDCEARREMGLRGRRFVEQKFDRNIVIKSYLKEIKALNLL